MKVVSIRTDKLNGRTVSFIVIARNQTESIVGGVPMLFTDIACDVVGRVEVNGTVKAARLAALQFATDYANANNGKVLP